MLVYKLYAFAVECIPAVRNKTELSSVQKITCITAIADKKIINVFCVFSKYLISIFSSAWPSLLLEFTTQEKKANQQLFLN